MSRRRIALPLIFNAALVAFIWWYCDVHTSFAVPPVPDILSAFRETWLFERVTSDVLPTLRRLVIGFTLSVAIAVPLGIALGRSRPLRLAAMPLLTVFRSIPPIALVPPAMILFGLGDTMKLVLVLVVCVWPVMLNTVDGVAELDRTMIDTSRVYRFSAWERLRYVILPAVAPRIFAGMQTSLAFAMIIVIASEYLAGTDGIGYFIFQAQSKYVIADMWAGILLLGLFGLALNVLFVRVQRKTLYWHAPDTERAL